MVSGPSTAMPRWSHAGRTSPLVNRRAHLGARIDRPRDLQGHRRREHLPATTSPRPATASAGAQPPTKGNQPGSQAASEQCHARRRHRLPGNRQTRGSMRLVSVTVRPVLHASPPRGRGRRRCPTIRIPAAAAPASTCPDPQHGSHTSAPAGSHAAMTCRHPSAPMSARNRVGCSADESASSSPTASSSPCADDSTPSSCRRLNTRTGKPTGFAFDACQQ